MYDYKSDIFSRRITKSNNTIYYNVSYQINASLLNLIMQVIKYMIADLLKFNKASCYNTKLLNLLTRH